MTTPVSTGTARSQPWHARRNTALALLVNVVRYARGRGPLSPRRARLTS